MSAEAKGWALQQGPSLRAGVVPVSRLSHNGVGIVYKFKYNGLGIMFTSEKGDVTLHMGFKRHKLFNS